MIFKNFRQRKEIDPHPTLSPPTPPPPKKKKINNGRGKELYLQLLPCEERKKERKKEEERKFLKFWKFFGVSDCAPRIMKMSFPGIPNGFQSFRHSSSLIQKWRHQHLFNRLLRNNKNDFMKVNKKIND